MKINNCDSFKFILYVGGRSLKLLSSGAKKTLVRHWSSVFQGSKIFPSNLN